MIKLIILRVIESYFRHRWLYLLPVVLLTGMAAISIVQTQPKFIAQGVLYVQKESFLATLTSVRDNNASWWLSPAQTTNNQIGELLKTDAFIRAVIQKTDLEENMAAGSAVVAETIEEARESLWSFPLGDNQLQINAAHENPRIAYQLVNGVIEAYIQWQINAELTESQAAQGFFSELIQQYETELESARQEMRDYIETHPAPLRGERSGTEMLEINRLQSALDLAASRYASALEKEENARLAMAQTESDARQTYQLIDAPRIPEKPETSLKELALNAAIFVLVGVIISAGAILGGALLDRSFRFPLDVQAGLSLPVIAVVPDMTPTRRLVLSRLRLPRRRIHPATSTQAIPEEGLPATELTAAPPEPEKAQA